MKACVLIELNIEVLWSVSCYIVVGVHLLASPGIVLVRDTLSQGLSGLRLPHHQTSLLQRPFPNPNPREHTRDPIMFEYFTSRYHLLVYHTTNCQVSAKMTARQRLEGQYVQILGVSAPAKTSFLRRRLFKPLSFPETPLFRLNHCFSVSVVLTRALSDNSLTTLPSGLFDQFSLLTIL